MEKAGQNEVGVAQKTGFNFNKLQAVACMASSAAVSIGIIYWIITSLS